MVFTFGDPLFFEGVVKRVSKLVAMAPGVGCVNHICNSFHSSLAEDAVLQPVPWCVRLSCNISESRMLLPATW